MGVLKLCYKITHRFKVRLKSWCLFVIAVCFTLRIVLSVLYSTFHPNLQLWYEPSDESKSFSPLELPQIKTSSPYSLSTSPISSYSEVFEQLVDQHCYESLPVNFNREYVKNETYKYINFDTSDVKKILVWNYAFGSKTMGFGYGEEPFRKACCKETRCFIAPDTSQIPFEEFDAVLFHYYNFSINYLPQTRSPHQRWIFFESEPAAYNFQNPDIFSGVFNWTMTYRRDSDVPTSYGYIFHRSDTTPPSEIGENHLINQIREKKRMVAAIVSHCSTFSNREYYINNLKKYLKVDVYGACGEMICSKKNKERCYEMIEKNYKFYLSFENSLCRDYVTEKFFNILRYNIIPVVFGFGNYKALAPPHSYIDILDFKTMEEVANYLIYLDRNDTAYAEYFRWKQYFNVTRDDSLIKAINFCSLCKQLNTKTKRKVYNNLRDWHVKKATCVRLKPTSWPEYLLGVTLKYFM